MNITIPKELEEAIKNDNLIIFAGSGLSLKFNLPDWKKLVIDIINSSTDEGLKTFIPILEIGRMQPLDVLEFLQLEHKRIHDYIEKNYKIKPDVDLTTHQNIIKLSSKIITTNYDNAFELADPTIDETVYDSSRKLINLNNKDKFVFKLHGSCTKEASDCIVFKADYDKLYKKDSPATQKFKEFITNNTILFIGFSFNDIYVKNIFDHINALFEGNTPNHFIITTDDVRLYKEYSYLSPIKIESYELIDSLILKYLEIKNSNLKQIDAGIITNLKIEKPSKIAVLYPDPTDIHLEGYNKIIGLLEGLDAEIHKGYLNHKTLLSLDDYDYAFILTKSFKGKLYIEEEDIKSHLVTIEELDYNILDDDLIVILIVDQDIEINVQTPYICVSSYKAEIIKRVIHKTLKNNEINFVENEIKVYNIDKMPVKINKGISKFNSVYGHRRKLEYNNKSKDSIVGRIEEQISIAKRLLSIRETNKLLNIKGSGGIGKTTLVKKVAYELYERGYFNFGVTFISCENIKSYDDFVDELTNGFRLNNITNFKEYLIENPAKFDLLIILDNFETVSNLQSEEYQKVLDILEFSTDFASIVITSRESLRVEFEDQFSLTSLTTDDALSLFTKYYGKVTDLDEIKILRIDILENLLNNNPLAIKLITKSIPKYSHLSELKMQLEDHFFEIISEDWTSIYKKEADLNVERTRSIYQSINYSYSTLTSREKLGLEILHLFPDGISLSNFKKCFNKKASINNISELDFRHLRDKSLIEDDNGILILQPLIRRFAEFQFSKRSREAKQKYYNDAYGFNCFILELIDYVYTSKGISSALLLHNQFKNNLLTVLDYMPSMDISSKSNVPDKKYFLNYIYDLQYYLSNEVQLANLKIKLNNLHNFFSDIENSSVYLEVLNLFNTYFHEKFDVTYDRMREIYSVEDMINNNPNHDSVIENRYKNLIGRVHSMEGHTFEYINNLVTNNNTKILAYSELYYLGIYDVINTKVEGFYYYEKMLVANKVDINEIEKYISKLYFEEHLEIMQVTYTLSKITLVTKDRIKKLVVTNPYTRGLKELMFAFAETDNTLKKKYFISALEHLSHIKYYYIEALYYYSMFLKNVSEEEFVEIYQKGFDLSRKYYYQFLEYKFINIKQENFSEYICNYSYYPINDLDKYLQVYNEKVNEYLKSKAYLN